MTMNRCLAATENIHDATASLWPQCRYMQLPLGNIVLALMRSHTSQLEFGNVDFLDTHQLRQRLSDNASRVRTRVQQV